MTCRWKGRRSCRIACLVAASAAAARADLDAVDRPRGPALGDVEYSTTIDPRGGVSDVDDYVGALAAGETLSISVLTSADTEFRPSLTLRDPDGAVVDAAVRSRSDGRRLVVKAFAVPRSGTWSVRVGAVSMEREADSGAYAIRFRVRPPKRKRFARERLGGEGPHEAAYDVNAVDGSRLSVVIATRAAGDASAVRLRSLTDPQGLPVLLPDGAVVEADRRTTLRDFVLDHGDGAYGLGVGTDADSCVYSLRVGVRPPPRPRGRIALSGDEPLLDAVDAPLTAEAGRLVHLEGAHFATKSPFPAVEIGGSPARVLVVDPSGTSLEAVVPDVPLDVPHAVTVRNPDGQATTRADYVRVVSRVPLDVARIEPSSVRVGQGATQSFTIVLTRPAPPIGAEVVLASPDGIGTVPRTVLVRGLAASATFDFTAGTEIGVGRIEATFGGTVAAEITVLPPGTVASIAPASVRVLEGAEQVFVVTLSAAAPPVGLDVPIAVEGPVGAAPKSVRVAGGRKEAAFVLRAADRRATGRIVATLGAVAAADVVVAPPPTIDLSGWRIVQSNSARTFTIPAGTVLGEGDYLVVGRSAAETTFEAFWRTAFGPEVHYVDGTNAWPNINGSETYELRDGRNVPVDGPTVAVASAGAAGYRRTPGTPAGVASSWTVTTSPNSGSTPGRGQSHGDVPNGIYVSQFSDATGTGNFGYEFVELYFDRLP